MTLARYLTWAHWAVFTAGVFVVAVSLFGSLNAWVIMQEWARNSALHDTYYIVYNFWDLVIANLVVILATGAICWGLRRLVRRLEGVA